MEESSWIKQIMQKLGRKQRLGAVNHPQSQGMCEKNEQWFGKLHFQNAITV